MIWIFLSVVILSLLMWEIDEERRMEMEMAFPHGELNEAWLTAPFRTKHSGRRDLEMLWLQ